jgi:ribosomal protein S18 acetylase RimI-like enzyme
MEYTIRPMTAADEPFLWQMLYYAAHVHEEADKTLADVQTNPTLALYVSDWGRHGDLGFLAVSSSDGAPLGAAWLRLFTGEHKAYSPTDDQTPELAIALLPQYTGQGIGSALLQTLLVAADPLFPQVALSVRAENPALRLYQRMGFVVINELVNRVGGLSYDMRYTCQGPQA